MGVARESCWVSRTKSFMDATIEYQEVFYDHDTTDGRDTKTEWSRGPWREDMPNCTSGACGNAFSA